MIGQGIVAHLAADSAVFELVDGNGYTRIHPQIIPQAVPGTVDRVPALVYTITAVDRQVAFCGTRGTVAATVELNSYATTYAQVRELADAVRRALIDYRGDMGGVVQVSACSLDAEFETQDIEPGLYRVVQSWLIWYKET